MAKKQLGTTPANTIDATTKGYVDDGLSAKESTSNKGIANGYASLDSGGKVPVAQLPNSIMEYQGTWNASTNTPTLANGTGSAGDVYRVSVAGTALSLTFEVGDYAIYNGSTWEKSDTTDAVASVAGRTGNVTLTSADVGLGNVDNTSNATERAATATLTNKTLTTPNIGSGLRDTGGAFFLTNNITASAANNFRISAAAAGAPPTLAAEGTDTDVSATIAPKGAGSLIVGPGTTTQSKITASGINTDLNLLSKGTGTVQANGVPVVAVAPGITGNVLTSDGTTWTSAAPTGGGGGSARVTSTVTSATTLAAAAGTQYLTYIGSGGSVTLPTAVGNTSLYTLKNIDTATKTIATVGDDPYFGSVTSLIQGNGDNNTQIFTDLATNPTSWSPVGVGVKLSTAVKKFGSASISFDGTTAGTCLYPTTAPSPNPYSFGTGDFTIEMWVYFNAIGNMVLVDGRASGAVGGATPTLYTSPTGVLTYYANGADRITAGSAVSSATWHHVAVSRSGTSTRMFLNGTQVGSTYTDSTNYAVAGQRPLLGIGAYDSASAKLNGYLDDIRVTKGIARYTANFTAPTAEFPVPQLIDGTYPLVLAPNQAIELASSGSNWSVVSDAATLPAFTTTPTSASITTLTVSSNPIQEFTGTTTHTVRLPSTGVVAGEQFTIINNSTGLLTLQTSTGAQIHVLAPGTESILTALVATPTTAAHWEDSFIATSFAAGKSLTVNNTLTLAGTDATTMTFPGASDTVVTLAAAQSLTNKTLTSPTLTTPVINGTPTGTGVATAATANTLVLRGAGGTITGTFVESTTAVGTIGATTTLTLTGTVQTATLTSNTPCTVTMPAVSNGASFVLYLRQPATGTPTTATFSGVRWGTAGAPVITAVLGRMDILTFFSDGTNWYGQVAQGYQY